MPWPFSSAPESILDFTESLDIIVPTLAYLPTSRKKLRKVISWNHSKLFTISTESSAPPACSIRPLSWSPMQAVLWFRVSTPSIGLSALFPLGSPTSPVAPPQSAMTLCPALANHESTMMPRRLPRWRLSAVGSKPQYTAMGDAPFLASSLASPSSFVASLRSPLSRRTSKTSKRTPPSE